MSCVVLELCNKQDLSILQNRSILQICAVLVAVLIYVKVQHFFIMKRSGELFQRITEFNNLRSAYLKAVKGKRLTPSGILFDMDADSKLHEIQANLQEGKYKLGKYTQFKIYDPKERLITAAAFDERIIHHAVMNILEPVFERQYIFHTYACRKGKGTHQAIQYAVNKAKFCPYYLKLDIRKYFDNIDHHILKQMLLKIIKDKRCLILLFDIIDSYEVESNKGLPIGNLTSQFFANLYLSSVDHFILEKLKPFGYERYMDDMLIFMSTKKEFDYLYSSILQFCYELLNLELKEPVYGACKDGIHFLGCKI